MAATTIRSPQRGTVPRPDFEAFDRATRLSLSEVVAALVGLLGARMVAYVAGVKETRAVREWADGSREVRQRERVEPRLRLALRIALMLTLQDTPAVAQSWLQGNNPELGDRVPLRMLREDDIEQAGTAIVAAARTFLAGG